MAKLYLPFDGRVYLSSPFGWRNLNGVRDYHKGVDLVGQDDITVRAPCDGVIGQSTMIPQYLTDADGNEYINPNDTWQWGNYVRLDTPDGLYIFMCHMRERLVSAGQKVTRGQALGIMGNTGYSFGSHCHFEVRRSDGTSINPAPYLGIPNTVGEYSKIETDTKTEDEDMDATKFKEMWIEMRKELQDNDAGQWSEEARAWAVSSSLIAGNGTEIRGEPNYMWADLLTREQLVTVLYRFAQIMGKA